MAGRTVTYTFVADIDNFARGVDGARRKASDFFTGVQKDLERLVNGRKLAAAFTEIGQSMTTAFTLPIVAGFGSVIKASSDFESAFAGVRKTVDGDTSAIEAGIRRMAKTMPVAATELAGIAANAGQLGVEKDKVLEFTETMARLGVSTNLTGEQAAMAFAKFQNVTSGTESVSQLGSAVVYLGNNFATTEHDIMQMATRLAKAGETAGLSRAEILGVSAALSAVGIEAEAGGSAVSRILIDMQVAARKGGEDLAAYAKIAKTTSTAFAQMTLNSPAAALQTLVGGLARIKDEGGDVFRALQSIGVEEIRTRDAALGLANASGKLGEAMAGASTAVKENTALTKESEERFKTLESQLKTALGAVVDVAIELGTGLLPAAKDVVKLVKNELVPILESAAKSFTDLKPSTQTAVFGIAAVAAAAGPAIWALGSFATSVGSIISAVKVLMATNFAANIAAGAAAIAAPFSKLVGIAVLPWMHGTATAAAALTAALAPLGIAIAAVAAAMVVFKIHSLSSEIDSAYKQLEKTEALILRNQALKQRQDQLRPFDTAMRTNLAGANSAMVALQQRMVNDEVRAAQASEKAAGAAAKATEAAAQSTKKAAEELQRFRDSWSYANLPGPGEFMGPENPFKSSTKRFDFWSDPSKFIQPNAPIVIDVSKADMMGWTDTMGGNDSAIAKATVNWTKHLETAAHGVQLLGLSSSLVGRTLGLVQTGLASGQQARSLFNVLDASGKIQIDPATGKPKMASWGSMDKGEKAAVGLSGLSAAAAAYQSGSVLGGAASGAAFGSQFGGVGAAIGAAVGGLLGFFGKKKEPKPEPPKQVDAETWKNFQSEQVSKGASGLGAAVGGIQLTSATDLVSQATIAGMQFWSIFKTQGLTAAAGATKDVIGKLVENLSQYGSEAATAVLAPIQQQIALAENDAFKGASEGARGFAEVLAGQVNARMPMTIEQFGAFGQQASAAFEQAKAGAIATGLSTEEATRAALQAVGPLVTTAVDAASTYGFAIDANTQSLLDQAAANGVAFATSSTDRLILSVDALTKALGGVPPAVGAITQAINGLPTERTFTMHLNTSRSSDELPVDPGNSFALGSGGLRDFGSGELAMLHGREAVLTEGQFSRLAAGNSSSSSPFGNGEMQFHFHIDVGNVKAREISPAESRRLEAVLESGAVRISTRTQRVR